MIYVVSGKSAFVNTPEGEKSVILVRWVDSKGNYGIAHADSMFQQDVNYAIGKGYDKSNSIPRL